MHFELYLRNKKNDENEIIRFLNSSARSFYSGSNTYGDKSFDIVLKSAFLSGITDLERTIRGTFDCDLTKCFHVQRRCLMFLTFTSYRVLVVF